MPKRTLLLVLLAATLPLAAQRSGPGTHNPNDPIPPWRFVEKDTPPAVGPFILYWLPASNKEMDRSPLLTSQALLDDADRCVKLEAVVPPNAALAEKLGATGKLPMAVLVDANGAVIARVSALKPAAVEQIVSDALAARDEAMYRDLTEAKRQATAGNPAAAIALYRKIWDDRCLFPSAGTEAQGALKVLGVVVEEPASTLAPDPNLMPHSSTTRPKSKPHKDQ